MCSVKRTQGVENSRGVNAELLQRDDRPGFALGGRTTFGDCTLSQDGTLITPDGQRHLSRRLVKILLALINGGESAVSSHYLLDSCWGAGSGNAQNLGKAIFKLRRAIAGSRDVAIESIYGHGYRLRITGTGLNSPDRRAKALAICDEAMRPSYDRREDAMRAALAMYEEALRLDATCIPAHTGFAETQILLVGFGQERAGVGWPAAQHALKQALHLDPQSAKAHALKALGSCLFDWDIAAAMSSLNVALKLAPEAYLPNEIAGRIWLFRGNPENAVACFRRALEASPMVRNTNGILAYALGCSGDTKAALAHIRETRRLDPGNPLILNYTAWVEAAHGDAEAACEAGAEVVKQLPHSATAAAVYAFALASAGRAPAAHAVLSSLEDKDKYVTRDASVTSHAWRVLGDAPAAVAALAVGARNRDYWLGMMLQHPANDPLRSQPGFRAVYDKVFGSKTVAASSMRGAP